MGWGSILCFVDKQLLVLCVVLYFSFCICMYPAISVSFPLSTFADELMSRCVSFQSLSLVLVYFDQSLSRRNLLSYSALFNVATCSASLVNGFASRKKEFGLADLHYAIIGLKEQCLSSF